MRRAKCFGCRVSRWNITNLLPHPRLTRCPVLPGTTSGSVRLVKRAPEVPCRGCTVGAKAWEGTSLNTCRNPWYKTLSGWHTLPLVHVLRCFTIEKPQDRVSNCHGESSHHPRRVLLRRETLHFEQKLAPRQKKLDKHPYFTVCNHTHKSWNSHKCVVPDRDGSNLQRVREVLPRRIGRGLRALNTPTHPMQNPQTSSAFPPSCLRTLVKATTETTENPASTNCSVAHQLQDATVPVLLFGLRAGFSYQRVTCGSERSQARSTH